jgi:hypothetical protein
LKKSIIAVFCILALSSLTFAGNVKGYNASYTHMDYSATANPTVDGQYVLGDEWGSSGSETFGTNGVWRDEWVLVSSDPLTVCENILIETSDATDDAGDYWQICFDGNADGGANPLADDYRVDITGHGATATVQWYKGTGTAWATTTAPAAASFKYAESLSTSPKISAAHYIIEMTIEKTSTDLPLGQRYALRIAYNDAHAGGNGLQAWPPAPAAVNVPDGWGYIDYTSGANPTPDVAPESLTIGLVLALSTVAVIGGSVLIRKKPLANLPKQVAV